MADKRMFNKKITDSDEFITLSASSQALYFHLNMGADDDGFNNQVQMAMFKAHASIDDLKILLLKNFIIQFEKGVIVIRHWRLNNYLQKDRIKPTIYQEELQKLVLNDGNVYNLDTKCIHSIDKIRLDIDKNSIYCPADNDKIEKIIKNLNDLIGTKFKSTNKETIKFLKILLNEYTEDEIIKTTKKMVDKWKNTKMEDYLRPSTLFRKSNFDEYYGLKEGRFKTQAEKNKEFFDKMRKELENGEEESN